MASSGFLCASSRAASFLRISSFRRGFSSGKRIEEDQVNAAMKTILDEADGSSKGKKIGIIKTFTRKTEDGKPISGANLYEIDKIEDKDEIQKRRLIKTVAYEVDYKTEKLTPVDCEMHIFG